MSPGGRSARRINIVVVTGMSGSGKSTAIDALEDLGYYCIDNLPTGLVPRFVELCTEAGEAMSKVGLGLDVRDVSYLEQWPEVRRGLENGGHKPRTLFLEASDEVLLRRFSETRRSHPMAKGRGLAEAIQAERRSLGELQQSADKVIDTSMLSVHDLKREVGQSVGKSPQSEGPAVSVQSFGYKHGLAGDSDLVFDVRFIPNPYFVSTLRERTGLDPEVASYVLEREQTRAFIERMLDMIRFLLPHYAAEGKAYLTISLGCTGGRHRSVAIAEEVARCLKAPGRSVVVRHRDIDRGED